MEKEMLTVKTIDLESLEKYKEISLQIMRLQQKEIIVGTELIEGFNRLIVKYFDNGNNINNIINSWGELIDTEKEIYILFNSTDLKHSSREKLNESFEEMTNNESDEMTLDITFDFEE